VRVKPGANSVYKLLLVAGLRMSVQFITLCYLDRKALLQRNSSYTRALYTILKMKIDRNILRFRIFTLISLFSYFSIFIETKSDEGLMISFLFEGFKVAGFWNKLIDLFSFVGLISLIVVMIWNFRKITLLVLLAYAFLIMKIVRHVLIFNDLYKYSNNPIFNLKLTFPIVIFIFFAILSLIQLNKLIKVKNGVQQRV
jgi:hypothetical protein